MILTNAPDRTEILRSPRATLAFEYENKRRCMSDRKWFLKDPYGAYYIQEVIKMKVINQMEMTCAI